MESKDSEKRSLENFISDFPAYAYTFKRYGSYGKKDMFLTNGKNLADKSKINPINGHNKKTFNPYSLLDDTFTSYPVIKRLSESNIKEIVTNQNITIHFGGKTTFDVGDFVMLHGGIEAKVTGKQSNSIILERQVPSIVGDYISSINNNVKDNKTLLLNEIIEKSESEINKKLAEMFLTSDFIAKRGSLSFKTSTEDADLIIEDDAKIKYAYYNRKTGDIVINQNGFTRSNQNDFERIVMHEFSHPLIDTLNYFANIDTTKKSYDNLDDKTKSLVSIAKMSRMI